MMKYTRTKAKEKINQEADERDLQSFFNHRRIKTKKMPRLKGAKSADFELLINSTKIIIELKSRFDDNSYNNLLDFIQKELSVINAGYDCSIQLDYRHKMKRPDINKWKSIKQEFAEKIKSLESNSDLPREFSFCLTDDSEFGNDGIERLLYKLENSLTIAVENTNSSNSLRFNSVSGSTAVFDARWICDRIQDAATQLKVYAPSIPKGVFFVNHTPHSWGYEEQLSPFFIPTCFLNTTNKNKDIIVSRIQQENILRSDNLEIISLYGFLGRTGGKITELALFVNCHADIQLCSDIVKKFRSFAHSITPRNRQNMSLVIREFQR